MTARRISAEALDLLKRWEGCVLHAYDDADLARPPRFIQQGDPVRGTLTIGYGHTRTVRPGKRIIAAEAERLLLVEQHVARDGEEHLYGDVRSDDGDTVSGGGEAARSLMTLPAARTAALGSRAPDASTWADNFVAH